jgi:G3E family GTPase
MDLKRLGEIEMDKPTVILVGGFLGSGKTTLLATVADRFMSQGKRVGLITNDQAANLVDSALFKERDLPVEEVSGGCFCCKFDDLIGAMDRLVNEGHPDFLLGEPVGSCTDLSATVMQPIKALHRDRYRLTPSSVLVDPDRVRPILEQGSDRTPPQVFPENVVYIYRKQLEEADIIVLNKIDLLSAEEQREIEDALRRDYPGSEVISLSAKEGTGIEEWLEAVCGEEEPGRTVTEVDYDVYAEGEAALGWLNAAYKLHADAGADWEAFSRSLMSRLRAAFGAESSEIAHLKILLKAGSGTLVANLTTSRAEPSVRGEIEGSPGFARLLLNVRAHIEPDSLRDLVERVVAEAAGPAVRVSTEESECFAPARPQPTHRYAMVV